MSKVRQYFGNYTNQNDSGSQTGWNMPLPKNPILTPLQARRAAMRRLSPTGVLLRKPKDA